MGAEEDGPASQAVAHEPIDLWRLSVVARPSGRAPQAQSPDGARRRRRAAAALLNQGWLNSAVAGTRHPGLDSPAARQAGPARQCHRRRLHRWKAQPWNSLGPGSKPAEPRQPGLDRATALGVQ